MFVCDAFVCSVDKHNIIVLNLKKKKKKKKKKRTTGMALSM